MATTTLTKNPQAAGGAAPTPQQRQPHRAPAAGGQPAPADGQPAPANQRGAQSRERLKNWLIYSFDNHLLESGMHHPAEKIIDEALSEHKELAYQWLAEFCMDEKSPSFAADVLCCLGRKPGLGTPEWRLAIVRSGLSSKYIQIRDAATDAADTWMDDDIMETLKAYVPTETKKWLRDSVQELIDHLQAK